MLPPEFRHNQEDFRFQRAVYQAFADLADTPVEESDVVPVLHKLSRHCVDLLSVSAAAVVLADELGALNVLAASSEQARLAEAHQLEITQQGPSLDCYQTGAAVAALDLAQRALRWPGFAAEARNQGFQTAHVLPMRWRQETIGTLTLYGAGTSVPSEEELVIAQGLADVAAVGISQQRTLNRKETRIVQLQQALDTRVVIEQAKGILASRGGLTVDSAFTRLRDYARSHSQRLNELAWRVVLDPALADRLLGGLPDDAQQAGLGRRPDETA